MAMEFGIFDHMVWPEGQDLDTLYEQKFDSVEEADRLGCFRTYHVAEHHYTRNCITPSLSPFLSAVSQRISKIRLGPLVYVLPIRNPVHFAEEISMLDHLTHGRLDLGLGSGISELELRYFGLDYRSARERSNDVTNFLGKYFNSNGEPFSFKGNYYGFENIEPLLMPLHPPIWIPTELLKTIPWLAENRINTIFRYETTHDAEHEVKAAFDLYRETMRKSPRSVTLNARNDEPKLGMHKIVYVAGTDSKAESEIRPALRSYGKVLNWLRAKKGVKTFYDPDRGPIGGDFSIYEDPDSVLASGIAIAGSPDTVAREIGKAMETGANYFLATLDFCLPHDKVIESMDRLATEVIPSLKLATIVE